MGGHVPAFMPPRFSKLLWGRSKGNDHHCFPGAEVEVSNSGILIAGANILIRSTKHITVAADGMHIIEYFLCIICIYCIIYHAVPSILG